MDPLSVENEMGMMLEDSVDHPYSKRETARKRRGPLGRLTDLFSNVWCGVAVFAMLFIYCSIGSAVPWVRQHRLLEMTEFEWFHTPVFNGLMLLLCSILIVTTVRRIPLRLVNAGVWSIHTGIITLCVGSYWYFGTKVEGDTHVFRRQVLIDIPGSTVPVSLVALPGNRIHAHAGGEHWEFEIQGTNSAWPILSDEHKGETAYAVNVAVHPPVGEPFIRQLLAGYPQYTEDIIPGKGRAIKSLGRKLVDEDLKLSLEYEPQEYFHVMQTWALFTRRVGDEEWAQRPITGMPRYHNRVASRDQVFFETAAQRNGFTPDALDLRVPPPEGAGALGDADLRVTGYLRYARLRQRVVDGGLALNPMLRVVATAANGRPRTYELFAFDREKSRTEAGFVEFKWLDHEGQLGSIPNRPSLATLKIAVPGADVSLDVPLTERTAVGRNGPFTPIEGTDYEYRIQFHNDAFPVDNRRVVSLAFVDIKTPERTWTRWVFDNPELTRDRAELGDDPHGQAAGAPRIIDEAIEMTYQSGAPPIIFAAVKDGPIRLIVNSMDEGRIVDRDVRVGEDVEIAPDLSVRVEALYRNATLQARPTIIPVERQQANAGEFYSMIRVEVRQGDRIESHWLQYNPHVLPGPQYAYQGRIPYTPEVFVLADGTRVEVVFSRERRKLLNPVAMEDFELLTHVGGYSGGASTIRNYVSRLRFRDGDSWSEFRPISVNAPTEYGGYWYFQSTWDKPPPSNPSGGMNYTGLGVGNRNGVHVQLAGCCISVSGMIFAFYVKPIIRRRRSERARAGIGRATEDTEEFGAETPTTVEEKISV